MIIMIIILTKVLKIVKSSLGNYLCCVPKNYVESLAIAGF